MDIVEEKGLVFLQQPESIFGRSEDFYAKDR